MSDDNQAQFVIDRLNEIHQSLRELRRPPGASGLLASFGWWTRIVRTAHAVGLLHQAGLAHEAAPLVRALIHHSVALIWLIEQPSEALPALRWEHGKEGDRMLTKALEREWELDPNSGPKRPNDSAPEGYRYLQNTEALCDRVDMRDAYVPFLLESKFTHPTGMSADAYLMDAGGGSVHLLQSCDMHTPLRGCAFFAAGATSRFASLAGLEDIANEADELEASLITQAED